MPFYLTPKQDDFNQIPELQVCIAEALYDRGQARGDVIDYIKMFITAADVTQR